MLNLDIRRAYRVEEDKTYETVIIWEEDDSGCLDRESMSTAWLRIVGEKGPCRDNRTEYMEDRGDWVAHLHRNGWVEISSCEGGAIGVLVEVRISEGL